MTSIKSCRRDAITDEMIVRNVRRFGPLTTTQICKHFGFSEHGILTRLKRIVGLDCKKNGRLNLWSAN
jgi:hypothetical protein